MGRKWSPLPPGMKRLLLYVIAAIALLWTAFWQLALFIGVFVAGIAGAEDVLHTFVMWLACSTVGVVIALLCGRALRK